MDVFDWSLSEIVRAQLELTIVGSDHIIGQTSPPSPPPMKLCVVVVEPVN